LNISEKPPDPKPELELELEVAHLLLIDVVGYSKLLVNEQIELIQKLNQIVRAGECFRRAEAGGKLIRLPTGDGMALLFFNSPEQPVNCALEITKELQSHPEIKIRMGVHSGPVNQVTDVNDRSNVAGPGINVGQRVLDCGDAGHILLSKHLADDLMQYRHWQPYLQDLGECEAKHGLRLHIVNLYKDGLGNPALPEKFKRGRRWRGGPATIRSTNAAHWPKLAMLAAMFLSITALIVSAFIFSHRPVAPKDSLDFAGDIPEKSIAVLPFQAFGEDKPGTHLTEGVQDEILTNLAKVSGLKVISRTSVMQYKTGVQRNLRDIAKQLGVAHVLEGSVQWSGNRVRVTAQLIDARTDAHIWADRYDRDLADVFALESEVAEIIVAQLQTKLSPREKAAIKEPPTTDLEAYELYAQAKRLIENSTINAPQTESLTEAIKLLTDAVQRDPDFALAYYQMAHAHDMLYFAGADHTPARLALADAAIQSLARLRPDSGEAHLARAKHFYWGHFNYDRARSELDLAKKSLPNDPLPFLLAGFIDRRQSRWEESTKNLERAVQLDPQNPGVLQQIARSYECLRRYGDAGKALDRAIALGPKDAVMRVSRAELEFHWHADLGPFASTVQKILAEDPHQAENIAEQWLYLAECQRDHEAARRALAALPPDGCHKETIPFARGWCEGLVAHIRDDKKAARAAFTKAHDETAKLVHEQPKYAEAICALGVADAVLGNKEAAVREGRRAVELLPVTKESIAGSLLVQYLALIYAWTGDKDHAFEQLAVAAKLPGYLSYGQLRFDPLWDPLRSDPRFDKIVASLAPK
jgi:TolB-like protein/Tfp pilus assembly protein PilF